MGCLNYKENFPHWFGNIHLSGPCNRACYFCIGQHMMALDPINNLDRWPLKNMREFLGNCLGEGISEINVTGSNTDPLLYKHTRRLKDMLEYVFEGRLVFGVRTNGTLILSKQDVWRMYDKASITFQSFDPIVYKKMMGHGEPPDLGQILEISGDKPIKINIVLGPENTVGGDLYETLAKLASFGVKTVNLREPYGQPHVGDPFGWLEPDRWTHGMPVYDVMGVEAVYWDVHYVEVESVNLYANGVVSTNYPVTLGHDPKDGKVVPQHEWKDSGRQVTQWLES